MPFLTLAPALDGPLLVRTLKPGLERRYRAHVKSESGDEYAVRIGAKVVSSKAPLAKGSPIRLELRFTDYRATIDEQKLNSRSVGGGQLEIGPSDLPAGLVVAGPQGPIWLPLVSLYLPDLEKEGDFSITPTSVGGSLQLEGKGTLAKRSGHVTVHLDGALTNATKKLGTLTVDTTFDGQGWPEQAEGTMVSADGTYHFTLKRG